MTKRGGEEGTSVDVDSNTILITGGASGIGLALAERFLRAGSQVIACGRREDKLRQAQTRHPRLVIRICDVAEEREREALHRWAVAEFPHLNVLVHTASPWRPAGPRGTSSMRSSRA